MQERFPDGLVFRKLNVRGKVFIEYIPAEHAWIPILAEQYMHINCLWVSGKYKGQGYSDQLLNQCIDDAKNGRKIRSHSPVLRKEETVFRLIPDT